MDPTKEELDQQIREIASSIHSKAGQLEEELTARYESVRGTLDKTLDTVTVAARAIAPKILIRSHPWIAAGTAVVTGMWIAHRFVRSRRPMQVMMVANPAQKKAEQGFEFQGSENAGPDLTTVVMPAPKKFRPELEMVKKVALTALTRYAGKALRKKLPHLSAQVQLVEDSVVGYMQARDPQGSHARTV